MLKIVAIKLNTESNSRKSLIQTLHTNLKRSTTQSMFKTISAGLIRQTKNEEKDSNSSNTSLFTSACLGFSCPAHASDAPKCSWTKFGRALGATIVVFCQLCTNPSGYKLGRRKSSFTLDSSLIFNNPRRSLKRFSMIQPPIFCSFFCSGVIRMFIGANTT